MLVAMWLPVFCGTAHLDRELWQAVLFERAEEVQNLLERGANPNFRTSDGEPVSVLAAEQSYYSKNYEIVKLLIAAHADVNAADSEGQTALIEAAEHDSPDLVNLLLAAGANPNAQNSKGQTALVAVLTEISFSEITAEESEIVEVLIAAHTDVNAADYEGRTALMQAAKWLEPDPVNLLLAAGANPNAQNSKGQTALMLATDTILHGEELLKVVEALLKSFANPDIQDKQGYTALMLAAQNGQPNVMKILLGAGANATLVSTDGSTAASLAAKHARIDAYLTETRLKEAAKEEAKRLKEANSVSQSSHAVVYIIDTEFNLIKGHGRLVKHFVKQYFYGTILTYDAGPNLTRISGAFDKILNYARANPTARIIVNMSWGTPEYSDSLERAFAALRSQGIVLVAAAGNEGASSCLYPAGYKGVIGLGSVIKTGYGLDYVRAPYSNYGSCVSLVANDEGLSNVLRKMEVDLKLSKVEVENMLQTMGTSFASAQATGIIADKLSDDPRLTVDEVIDQLPLEHIYVSGFSSNPKLLVTH